MRWGRRRAAGLVLATTMLMGLAVVVPAGADDHEPAYLPVVFVHGAQGSGAQYETQAKRWASNDYPKPVAAIDRISATPAVMNPILDDFFDDLMAQTGDDQVYVVGHSQGVAVMNAYLNSSPERAARVAKYIGIDSASGLSPDACPGDVPCAGIWGRGNPERRLGTQHNVQFADQGHTEVVGSEESFKEQYRFFVGEYPQTSLVLPEDPNDVTVAGRALHFPANTAIEGASLLIWEVDQATGQRVGTDPIFTTVIDSTGDWGPVPVHGERYYELALTRPGIGTQHFYYEPFARSDHLVRLLVSPAGSALANLIERSPGHSQVTIQRQKEWWGNHPVDSDELWVSTTSASGPDQPPVNIANAGTVPVQGNNIAILTWDAGSDGVSNPNQLIPGAGAFLTAVDVYYPAATPPDGTITLEHHARGESVPQVLNVPNWASEQPDETSRSVTVSFNDYVQEFPEPDPELSQRILTTIDPIAAGSLVVSVDPEDRTVVMPTMELAATGDRWETSGELRPVLVTDTRFGAPGWSVSGQITPTVGQTFDGQYLGWAPSVLTQAPGQGVAPGPVVPSGFGGGDGLGVSQVLGSAPIGQGTGTATLGADLALELPTHMPSGVYSVLLTLTAI